MAETDFNFLYSHRAVADMKNLGEDHKKRAKQALQWVEQSPEPDGITKKRISSNTCSAVYSDIVVLYTIEGNCVTFRRVALNRM